MKGRPERPETIYTNAGVVRTFPIFPEIPSWFPAARSWIRLLSWPHPLVIPISLVSSHRSVAASGRVWTRRYFEIAQAYSYGRYNCALVCRGCGPPNLGSSCGGRVRDRAGIGILRDCGSISRGIDTSGDSGYPFALRDEVPTFWLSKPRRTLGAGNLVMDAYIFAGNW